MMYGSFDIERNSQNSCHFGLFIAQNDKTLPPLTTQEIKILKKWKTLLQVISF